MADEAAVMVEKTFTDILDGEQAQAEEELKRLRAGEKPSESPETPTPEGAAPEPTPPVQDAAPPPPPPVQAEPEKKGGEGEPWRLLRMKERENKQLAERLAELERRANEYESRARGQQPAAQPEVPSFEADPALNLKHGVESVAEKAARLEAEQQRLQAQIAQQAEMQAIQSQEQAFEREHPDYRPAIQHLINSELEDFRFGLKPAAVAQINRALMGGDGMVKQAVDALAAQGMSEDDAISAIAENTYINSRAGQLREAARVMGKSVPELGYAMAQRRGYKGAAPAATPPPTQANEALQRVRQAQQVSRAGQTLSEMDTTAPQQERKFTRQDVLNMSDSDIDNMFANDPSNRWWRE